MLRIYKLLNDKVSWMPDKMVGIVFLKYLRIISELYKDEDEKFRNDYIEFICLIWKTRNNDCKKVGRDLLKIAIEVSKLPALSFIFDELAVVDKSSGECQYWPLLFQPFNDFNIYIQHLLPYRLEEMMIFILKNVDECNFNRHMNWLMAKYRIEQHVCN